jgi:hypothetical protein
LYSTWSKQLAIFESLASFDAVNWFDLCEIDIAALFDFICWFDILDIDFVLFGLAVKFLIFNFSTAT